MAIVTSIAILVIAAIPRFTQPDESLSLDEAEYALAAQKGFRANYLDTENTRFERHYHGPMIAYMIRLGVLSFGQTEKAIRFPSRVIGVLTCLLLFWGCLWVFKNGFLMGAFSGLLLALSPVHAHVSGVANMHAPATFLIVAAFFQTLKAITSEKPKYLYLLAITLGLLFCTIEYGFIVSGIVVLCFLLTRNRHLYFETYRLRFSKSVFWAMIILIVTILLFWFAGIAKLYLLKNLLYYLRYSRHGHPILFRGELTYHVPWWAYLYWFSKLSPTWLVLSLAGLIFFIYRWIRQSALTADRVLAVFIFVLLMAMFRQHIMSARYGVYVIPFFCLLGATLLSEIFHRNAVVGSFMAIGVLVAIALTDYRHIQPTAQGDMGYREAAQYLQENATAEDKILTWYQPILRFYLPMHPEIYNYFSGGASLELLAELQANQYRYVLFYTSQIRRWPDDPGYLYVKEHYVLCNTIYYKGEPVIWIYRTP